uniref:Uncharacterized protein n=1 Tax=Lotus japonicus TaxID=34305 RepID=I3T564_LOTJA|nr:unknown [Lotus japonicus]
MQLQVMEHCGYVHEQSLKWSSQLLGRFLYKNPALIEHDLMQSMPKDTQSKP